jgi:hypothetical protein
LPNKETIARSHTFAHVLARSHLHSYTHTFAHVHTHTATMTSPAPLTPATATGGGPSIFSGIPIPPGYGPGSPASSAPDLAPGTVRHAAVIATATGGDLDGIFSGILLPPATPTGTGAGPSIFSGILIPPATPTGTDTGTDTDEFFLPGDLDGIFILPDLAPATATGAAASDLTTATGAAAPDVQELPVADSSPRTRGAQRKVWLAALPSLPSSARKERVTPPGHGGDGLWRGGVRLPPTRPGPLRSARGWSARGRRPY